MCVILTTLNCQIIFVVCDRDIIKFIVAPQNVLETIGWYIIQDARHVAKM